MTRFARRLACALTLCSAAGARATPNVPLEDPVYLQLARLRAEGKLPAYLGGATVRSGTRYVSTSCRLIERA